MSTRAKCLITLIALMTLDILPLPVVGSIGLYVVIKRPRWFRDLVNRLYDEEHRTTISAGKKI
ncbi:hypothetical protein [Methylocaldum sp.]|uniref:hypothetical protein n=1 Tax=Methylocaldum sp. TaxID=1969727 RepID=UPI002D616E44|nr:hypothetical protein [Methylocaldum sp.]HYE37674.1 hypothetical protein [Methylocaldum sp.]